MLETEMEISMFCLCICVWNNMLVKKKAHFTENSSLIFASTLKCLRYEAPRIYRVLGYPVLSFISSKIPFLRTFSKTTCN